MISTAVARTERRGTALTSDTTAMRRVGLVRPTSNPAEVMEAHKEIAAMVAQVLEAGTDYGEIPGTDNKKALFKAGAERLAFGVGASIVLEVIEAEIDHNFECDWVKRQKEWFDGPNGRRQFRWVEQSGTSRGLYRYVVRARLVRREDDATLGEGIGACSTMESKYIDRPRDSENTVLKMAKKRAAVDAVLSTLALTGRFAPEEADDDIDDDGVVKDPTDGLTLAEALAHEINGVAFGTMGPKGLASARSWCQNKLQDNPTDARLRRIAAMIELVMKHREANPLPPKEASKPATDGAPSSAEAAAAPALSPSASAPAAARSSAAEASDDDLDDGLPF